MAETDLKVEDRETFARWMFCVDCLTGPKVFFSLCGFRPVPTRKGTCVTLTSKILYELSYQQTRLVALGRPSLELALVQEQYTNWHVSAAAEALPRFKSDHGLLAAPLTLDQNLPPLQVDKILRSIRLPEPFVYNIAKEPKIQQEQQQRKTGVKWRPQDYPTANINSNTHTSTSRTQPSRADSQSPPEAPYSTIVTRGGKRQRVVFYGSRPTADNSQQADASPSPPTIFYEPAPKAPVVNQEPPKAETKSAFSTALSKLQDDEIKQGKTPQARAPTKRKSNFVVPRKDDDDAQPSKRQKKNEELDLENPLYKNIDPAMIERINNEILNANLNVRWSDIAGLEDVKYTLNEMIILPHKRPELFTGLRQPPRGMLLFGPPGNGKTLIAKAVATESNLTFFAISASSLTSKWIGEGEKMVKALFAVARVKQPSFIFIDEIDSILTTRGAEEHESTRRLKTEFLLQFDGATSGDGTDKVTVMGATNRPQDLDEAARRRLTKRIYVPLPDHPARQRLIETLLRKENHALSPADINFLAESTDGFSGNDLSNLCADAAMGPLREQTNIEYMALEDFRPLGLIDFQNSLKKIRPSVSRGECIQYEDWDKQFGSSGL